MVKNMQRGMTLIDVVVGTSIMLIIFLGIFGAFRISIELVFSTKAKTGAISILTEKLEYIRGLPYDSVGTVGGIPSGNIPQIEQVSLNGLTYTVSTLIQYVDAPEDGLDINDENGITADYKTVKVEIFWNVKESSRSTFAVTRIAPIGQESLEGGGTLRVNVFDNEVDPVEGAAVRIVNSATIPAIDVSAQTNTAGSVSFPGTPEESGYEIYVSKTGYSSAQTYGVTAGNPNPSPIHVSVAESETTTASFAIDLDSVLRFFTFEAEGPGSFDDTFADETNLSSTNQVVAASGALVLEEITEGEYAASGNALSTSIAPSFLASWDEITFASTTPQNTTLVLRLYYFDGSVFTLISDDDLPNNSTGFTENPIDISGLDAATYTSLQLGAFLDTADPSETPELLEWSLSYSAGPSPLPNISFDIHGTKTIGTAAGGQPVYKYDDSFTTTQFAEWFIDPIEWDEYTVTLANPNAYDVVERCPNIVAPAPDQTLDVSITLGEDTNHSLRAVVTDENGAALSGATVTLSGAGAAVGTTSACGQIYFGDLSEATYTVTVERGGYQTEIENVDVSDETEILFGLTP